MGTPTLEIITGDITTQAVDAIVNAANRSLRGGGGVDGAIHSAGGPSILAESLALGGCATGDAKATGAGELSANHVIHAVGPIYDGSDRAAENLASCHRRSIEVADELGCISIAFPAISCGIYGYPPDAAAPISLAAVMETADAAAHVRLVRFVLFGEELRAVFATAADELQLPFN